MIIFGLRNKVLATESIPGTCPVCKENNCLQMTLYQQYVTLFFIPSFPTEKKEASVCTRCGAKLQLRYMSPAFTEIYNRLKSTTPRPLWLFTGCGIMVIGLIALLIDLKFNNDKIKQFIVRPQKNDIFEIRTKESNYTLYKVVKTGRDSAYFIANKYQISEASGIDQLYDKGEQGFDASVTYGIPISRLIKMNNDGAIIDIKRN